MTTIEFIEKNLHKAKINLEKAKQRPNVSPDEIAMLEEQIKHYERIGRLLDKQRKEDEGNEFIQYVNGI